MPALATTSGTPRVHVNDSGGRMDLPAPLCKEVRLVRHRRGQGFLAWTGSFADPPEGEVAHLIAGCITPRPALGVASCESATYKPSRSFQVRMVDHEVSVAIYDLPSAETVNSVLRPLQTGFYHVGVQVQGFEYSFDATPDPSGSGVWCCRSGMVPCALRGLRTFHVKLPEGE
ncbi:unnamed protein product, partial [Symbiodinium sp. CCMP2592]